MSVVYDPRDPAVIEDPFPVLRRLQAEDPVHWSEILKSWVLTRYDDVRAALADPRLSADRLTSFLRHQAGDRPLAEALAELGRSLGMWAVFTDPPLHTRLRGLLTDAFTPRAVETLRPTVRALVDALIDGVAGAGRLDLVRDIAAPLPVAVIGDLLGVPRADGPALKRWSDDLATFVGSAVATPDKYERAAASLREMNAYFRALAAERRARPRQDVLSALVAAAGGGRLADDELVASCTLLLFAGHETTTNLIGNGVLALLRHPDQCERWRRDPTLTATAVEELLRFEGPGQALVRVALDDLAIGGRRIRRGDRLFVMINAANRDPRRFVDPDRLDLGREPNPHLTFGHGQHFCVGAPLARLEAQVALPRLLERLPGLALAAPRLEWIDSLIFRGVRALPLTFGAG
ncbi:MAG TPA: cytochrome P450 [Calidithermus sp.]|nr:cytochrome P450 [Calidithermus sp.]